MEPHHPSGRAELFLQPVLRAAEASLFIDEGKVFSVAIALVADLLAEKYDLAACIAQILNLTETGTAAPSPTSEALLTAGRQLPATALTSSAVGESTLKAARCADDEAAGVNEVVARAALYTFSFIVTDGARDGIPVGPTYEALVSVQSSKSFPRSFPAHMSAPWAAVLRREI